MSADSMTRTIFIAKGKNICILGFIDVSLQANRLIPCNQTQFNACRKTFAAAEADREEMLERSAATDEDLAALQSSAEDRGR